MRTIRCLLLLVLVGCQPAPDRPETAPPADPARETTEAGERWFEERAAAAGISFVHRSGAAGSFYSPEIDGSGVGLCDVDGDGDLDAYLVQGGGFDDPSSLGGNRLYRNRGDGTFEDVSATAGAPGTAYGMGVACGDYDADGDLDLFVTQVGPDALYRNRGDGIFEDVSAAAGIQGIGNASWSTSALFVDFDLDNDLDLFVTRYLYWTPESEQECFLPNGRREYCSPLAYRAPAPDSLFENRGDGTFVEVSGQVGLGAAFGNGLGATAADFDGDGKPEIYVANDQTPNQLWRWVGTGYTDEALLTGSAVNRVGGAEAGMGVMAADPDRDGDLDLFLSHIQDETNTFYRNEDGQFDDATPRLGLAESSFPFTGFGLGFADFDQDGHLDLYVANGRVKAAEPSYAADPYAEPDLLYRGDGQGGFAHVPGAGTGIATATTARGAAFGDVDGDGDVDVLINDRDAPPRLLINTAAKGHWLRFRLLHRQGLDAHGALARLTTGDRVQWQHAQPGYSYLSSNDPRVHFGLGAAALAEELEVRWPDGSTEAFGPFEANTEYEIRQGTGR